MLPSGLGQINYNHSVFAQLIIIGSNWVLGILALLALVWEVYNLIKSYGIPVAAKRRSTRIGF